MTVADSAGPAAGPKLDAVQLLRAVAASMVVFGHVLGNARDRSGAIPPLRYAGGAGVDVFFLISGFIMVYASGRMFGSAAGARDFMLRRLVRIVPLYWGVTVIVLMLDITGHHLPSAAAIAASLAFVPFDTRGAGDGFAFPIVDLGWTLNYEMLFYVVFALCIPLGRGRCIVAASVLMAALVAFGAAADPGAVAVRFWTRPIVFEFIGGMIIASARLDGKLALSAAARLALIAAGAVLYFADPLGLMAIRTTPNEMMRVFGWGIPAALLLLATVAGPTSLGSRATRAGVLLGDASYALYLLHPLVIAVLVRAAAPLLDGSAVGAWAFVVVAVVVAMLGSVLIHKLVERPVTSWVSRRLAHAGAPIGRVPLPPDAELGPR